MGRHGYGWLQFRMLNTKKGPAVWAPRAQCDKKAYQFRLKWICEREPNLDLRQGPNLEAVIQGREVVGVETTLEIQYHGTTVIVTTGTFLRGPDAHRQNQQSGGRSGEAAGDGLSGLKKEIGLEPGRLRQERHQDSCGARLISRNRSSARRGSGCLTLPMEG